MPTLKDGVKLKKGVKLKDYKKQEIKNKYERMGYALMEHKKNFDKDCDENYA